MLHNEILISVICLIVCCSATSIDNGLCLTITDEESVIPNDSLICRNATRQQIIDAIRDYNNKCVTKITLLNCNIKTLPLLDVLDTDLRYRLRYLAVIGNVNPLMLEDDSFCQYKKIDTIYFESTEFNVSSLQFFDQIKNLKEFKLYNIRYRLRSDDAMTKQIKLKSINSEKVPIPIYPAFYLVGFPDLENISLPDSRIEVIQDRAFDNNRKLRYISLKDNLITKLPDELFNPLKYLYHLDLSNNPIKKCVPLSVIDAKDYLRHFYINDWPCSTLKRCLDEYKKKYSVECAGANNKCQSVVMRSKYNQTKVITLSKTIESSCGCNVDYIPCISDSQLNSYYERSFIKERLIF